MDKLMYFGNRNYMQWVKCPEAGATYDSQGSSQSAGYLNGGAFRRNSLSAAKRFNMSWALTSRDNIRSITDYAEGVYGPGAIYWGDPFTMDKNMLTQSFATPSLGGYDGVILDGTDERPELVPTSANALGYPVESARYVIGQASAPLKHWIPVPAGHTAWVGAHGDPTSTGGLRVQPTVRNAPSGGTTIVPITPVDSSQRVTNSFPGVEQGGIEVSLQGGADLPSPTNMAAHPSFETATTAIEVRRNHLANPRMVTTGDWAKGGATSDATITSTADGIQLTTNAAFSAGASLFYNVTQPAASEGQAWVGGFTSVSVPLGYPAVTIRAVQRVYATTQVDGNGPTVTINPGETKAVLAGVAIGGVGAISTRLIIQPVVNSMAAGSRMIIKNAIVEQASTLGPYFDGTASPDPDLTASWTAIADSSPSILTGQKITAASTDTAAARGIRSSMWSSTGSYSLRTIPTGTNSASYTIVQASGLTIGKTYRMAVKCRLAAAQAGTLNANARTFYTGWNTSAKAQAPNTPGVHELEITVTATSTGASLVFYNGSTTTDVWWDDLMIVEAGTYAGPYFDGNTNGASWSGAPNASTSSLNDRFTTLAGVIVQVLKNGVQPETGGFISGQGHSGCDWNELPSKNAYSAAMDLVGVSASFIETEQWR